MCTEIKTINKMAKKTTTPLSDRAGVLNADQKHIGITKYLPKVTSVKAPKAGKFVLGKPNIYSMSSAGAFKQLGFTKYFPEPEQDDKFYVYCKEVKHPLMEGLRIIIEESGSKDIPWITVECHDQSESDVHVPIVSRELTTENLNLVMTLFGKMTNSALSAVVIHNIKAE